MTSTIKITNCPICGDPLKEVADGQNCLKCGSRARLRSMPLLLERLVAPLGPRGQARGKPLLAFAMTGAEAKLLAPYFPESKSVSLFGDYRAGHEVGVDIRDLSRYPDAFFSGVFGSIVFDYFPEHEQALAECFRVIAPGGVFITHIAPYRLLDGMDPPSVRETIKGRPGYFEYLPEGQELPDVKLGRDWFIDAMRRSGFEVTHVVAEDAAPATNSEWFLGVRDAAAPQRAAPAPSRPVASAPLSAPPAPTPAPAPAPPAPSVTQRAISKLLALFESKGTVDGKAREVFRIVIPNGPGGVSTLVVDELNIAGGPDIAFMEDAVHTTADGATSREIVVCDRGREAVFSSSDLGRTWRRRYASATFSGPVRQAFTLQDGRRVVKLDKSKATYLFDTEDNLISVSDTGVWNWHGSQGVGQSASGTVMFAEYAPLQNDSGIVPLSVWRLRPGATSWEAALTLDAAVRPPAGELRHFHTCSINPSNPSQWILSSGDSTRHSRIWISNDDGERWNEVDLSDSDLSKVRSDAQAATVRFTQFGARPSGALIWGTDDLLRSDHPALIQMTLDDRPRLEVLHVFSGGNPIRNTMHLGGDVFLFLSEAKNKHAHAAECAIIDLRTGAETSLRLPNLLGAPSPVTDSLGSRRLVDGVAFLPALGSAWTNARRGILRLRLEPFA